MKPLIQKITPFDAGNEYTFNIVWTGTIPNANEIIIYDADSLAEVYRKKIETHSLTHTITPKTLHNGKQYIVQCYIYDTEDVQSELSDKLNFRTFTTPIFESVLKTESTIDTSSVTMNVIYSQAEGEKLAMYKFMIFDSTHTLLQETDTFYDTTNISYTFKGLDNKSDYYLLCTGSTINGMEISTGEIHVTVSYKDPSDYAKFLVETEPSKGWNKWYTNIVIVSYRGEETYTYVNDEEGNAEYIDLTDKSIYYGNDGSFSIPEDATIIISGKGLFKTDTIFKCYDAQTFDDLTIQSYVYDDRSIRFKLVVKNGLNSYIIYSDALCLDSVDIDETELVIEINKNNGLYNIKLYIKEV